MRRTEPCDGAYWHSVPLRCSRCNGTESDHAPSEPAPAGMPPESRHFCVNNEPRRGADRVVHKLDYDALRSWATARVAEWEKAYASLAPVAIELRERAEKAEAANVVYEGQMKADSHKITQLRAAIDAAKEPR